MQKVLSAIAALAITASGAAFAYPRQDLTHLARISMSRAQAIARRARPGRITDRELEREHGGSGLRYSFDIRTRRGTLYEVGVDARNGRVLENNREGPHPD